MLCSLRAQDFNDKSYWAGPLLSLQKVTVAGVLVFYEPSYTQTLAGLLIAMWWAIMIACLFPYRSLGENLCASVLNCSVGMIMVGVIASRLLDEGAELERYFASSVRERLLLDVLPLEALEEGLQDLERQDNGPQVFHM